MNFRMLKAIGLLHNEKDFAQDIQNQLIESIASVEKVYFDKENQKSRQFKKVENAHKAYLSLLNTLALPPKIRPIRTPSSPSPTSGKVTPPRNMAYAEKHLLSPSDILYLADACPTDLNEKTTIPKLGRLLNISLSRGHFPDTALSLIAKGTKRIGGSTDATKKMSAARLLISAGLAAEAGKFLPEIENSDEPEVLDIIATYHLALHTIEPGPLECLVSLMSALIAYQWLSCPLS